MRTRALAMVILVGLSLLVPDRARSSEGLPWRRRCRLPGRPWF